MILLRRIAPEGQPGRAGPPTLLNRKTFQERCTASRPECEYAKRCCEAGRDGVVIVAGVSTNQHARALNADRR